VIGHFAAEMGGHLTAFHRAEHAGEMTMADVGETDFAVMSSDVERATRSGCSGLEGSRP
jgi:hypothetical protein